MAVTSTLDSTQDGDGGESPRDRHLAGEGYVPALVTRKFSLAVGGYNRRQVDEYLARYERWVGRFEQRATGAEAEVASVRQGLPASPPASRPSPNGNLAASDHELDDPLPAPEFLVAVRGYDRQQVDRCVADCRSGLAKARLRAITAEAELTRLSIIRPSQQWLQDIDLSGGALKEMAEPVEDVVLEDRAPALRRPRSARSASHSARVKSPGPSTFDQVETLSAAASDGETAS